MTGAFLIQLNQIEPDPEQPRKNVDQEHIDELAASIKALGVLQPITIRFVEAVGKYRIIAGECRFTASKQAGLTEIPCWVRTPKENEILLEQVIENWQRADLNPFELADSLAILRDANGYTQQQLASVTGKSKGEISKILAILDLAPDVQVVARSAHTELFSKRHLYALSRLPTDRQETILTRIQREKLTARDVEKIAERMEREFERTDSRGARHFRRSFKTSLGYVTFTFRSNTIADQDVIEAMHEIKRQLAQG